MNRLLLITYEGAPLCFCTTPGEVRERLAQFQPADADLLSVWAIYRHGSASRPHEVTAEYADAIPRLRRIA